MSLSYKIFKRYVNKDLQAYFEEIFCNSCTPLSILICILQTRVDFAVKHKGPHASEVWPIPKAKTNVTIG